MYVYIYISYDIFMVQLTGKKIYNSSWEKQKLGRIDTK